MGLKFPGQVERRGSGGNAVEGGIEWRLRAGGRNAAGCSKMGLTLPRQVERRRSGRDPNAARGGNNRMAPEGGREQGRGPCLGCEIRIAVQAH